jgi:hypothetical protein
MKIRYVGTELFYADGRTDRHDEATNNIDNQIDATITVY